MLRKNYFFLISYYMLLVTFDLVYLMILARPFFAYITILIIGAGGGLFILAISILAYLQMRSARILFYIFEIIYTLFSAVGILPGATVFLFSQPFPLIFIGYRIFMISAGLFLLFSGMFKLTDSV